LFKLKQFIPSETLFCVYYSLVSRTFTANVWPYSLEIDI